MGKDSLRSMNILKILIMHLVSHNLKLPGNIYTIYIINNKFIREIYSCHFIYFYKVVLLVHVFEEIKTFTFTSVKKKKTLILI